MLKQIQFLKKRWLHSHEEDTSGNLVFRPEGTPLPPSRGREIIDMSGWDVSISISGPDDRPSNPEKGTLTDKELRFSGGRYTIVSAEVDRLVLRRLSNDAPDGS